MHPKPVRRVAPDGDFEGAVYVAHDRFRRSRLAFFASGDFIAGFNPPSGEPDAIADADVQRGVVAQRENGGGGAGGTVVGEKWQAEAVVAGVLIGQESEQQT